MKKILLIGTDSIHLYNFYIVIKDLFDEIEIVIDKEKTDYNFGKSKIHVINFSAKNIFRFFRNIKILRKIAKEFKPDIIHSQQANTTSFMAVRVAKKTKTPIVVTAWGSDILLTPTLGFFYKKMVLYIIKNANAFTADAKFVAEKMDELAKAKLDTTIANFASIEISENPVKENIIYSNRLMKKLYRIDRVIQAFAVFLKNEERKDWKLIIAGTGEELATLQKLSKSLNIADNIEFTGWLNHNENKSIYEQARIFVSIPESDGTSISLLEAMGAGCIPIVSDLPANREWITHSENGFIVNDFKSNFFEEALKINSAKAISINQELIRNKASFKANQDAFLSVYKKYISI
ncbi:MAG: glycosyltransferase family 4 protein [Bacteroidales bacterium]|jgi:glycosyltransferase involved in cell wall biosynthesis|nr:glycosyltransferase family 4 protein [Bacteroidales bacterium]